MVPLCTRILAHGETCGSPAMRGRRYCFHHQPRRAASFARRSTTRPGYQWYSLSRAIPTMCPEELRGPLAQILDAALDNRIAPRRAGKLLRRVNTQVRRYCCAEQA